MGVFRYSAQKGSYSDKHYVDDITDEEKTRRALHLMKIQKDRYLLLNQSLLGTTQRVMVDEYVDGKYHCRTEHSTPIADPKVIVNSSHPLTVGSFCQVVLTDTLGKDIAGKAV